VAVYYFDGGRGTLCSCMHNVQTPLVGSHHDLSYYYAILLNALSQYLYVKVLNAGKSLLFALKRLPMDSAGGLCIGSDVIHSTSGAMQGAAADCFDMVIKVDMEAGSVAFEHGIQVPVARTD
jgi:hypothetical protein